jgi:hypothetical protein
MNVVISNIKFPTVSGNIDVPVSLESVKDWLSDYSITYADDKEALIVYIRTALFMLADPVYDFEYTEHYRIEHNEQKLCVDAFDHKHIAYTTVPTIITVPEAFYLYISDEELAVFKTDANDLEDYISVAIYDGMRRYLPIDIEVIIPADQKHLEHKYTTEQLKYRLLNAFRDKLDQVLDSMHDMSTSDSPNEATRYVDRLIEDLYAL